jgi:DNA primase
MDAIAVTLAGRGRYIRVAPHGASLTEEQALQLARIGTRPILATDADLAGRIAAERDFWMLTCYRLDPLYARLLDGTNPAELLAVRAQQGSQTRWQAPNRWPSEGSALSPGLSVRIPASPLS